MMRWLRYALLIGALLDSVSYAEASAHDIGARGTTILGWQTEEIARVVSFTPYGSPGEVQEIEGQRCLSGYQFYFDVLDNFAFDTDEAVELVIRFDLAGSARTFRLEYDKNGAAAAPLSIDLPAAGKNRFHVERVRLQRARFAGRGEFGTDFRIAAFSPGTDVARSVKPRTTICDIRVERSFATPREQGHGWLDLTIRDEHGKPTPARMTMLDASGRMPLPGAEALEIKDFSERSRLMLLPAGTVNWPAGERYAYYVDGNYGSRLPAGEYTLVATKGIEYRYGRRRFRIEDGKTLDLSVDLKRWVDMPARGWTAGDVHMHLARRDDAENHSLWLQAQAEDLHITNSLQMGNVAATYFPQAFWGATGIYGKDNYFLVAGQEDPRTAIRGHTVHLALAAPVRNPARYLSYHEVFEQVAAQGGVSGYAHLDRLGVAAGMALDVPFGNVKFIEVLQRGEFHTDLWFDFLNLGFKIAPASGSDVPYGARIGDVRSYVKTRNTNAPELWFDGLGRGATFATNGPIIEFGLNGAGMGDEVRLAQGQTMELSVKVSINPDIDVLERVELIEQGKVVREATAAGGSETLQFTHSLPASHGTWFVVRAFGKRQVQGAGSVAAVSAPIYVSVDGQKTWQRNRVATIAAKMQSELDAFAASTLASSGRLDEWFETEVPWTATWSQQHAALQTRLVQAKAKFDQLVEMAGTAP